MIVCNSRTSAPALFGMGIVEAGSGVCPVIWALGESTVSGSESA
jgi:hypothetical protein